MKDPLNEILATYARFNAARSLAYEEGSAFELLRFGDALALVDSARPGSAMCNRVLGLDEKAAAQLKDILAAYDRAGTDPQFDIAAENLFPGVIEPLVERGYSAKEALTYLSTNPKKMRTAPSQNSQCMIERWEHDRADAFLELLKSSGVECAPDLWERRREHYCTDAFRTFVASWDGEPCAWGTTFVDRNAGYLANAFTLESHRNRGCHLALLHARLDDARDLGLRKVYTDVLANGASHRNCKRAGFTKLTVMTSWAKE